jgi:ubiquinol-cytochrome c reductase cytochrome c subunit
MPLAASGPQAEVKPSQFTDEQVTALYTFVGSKSAGPGIPDQKYLTGDGDVANGAELFRVNCAMCHNVAGAGGALTQGKYAPALHNSLPVHIYLSPTEKADIISYLQFLQENPSPGGFDLGSLGPVSEGLFIWIFGLGGIVAITVWLTAKSN